MDICEIAQIFGVRKCANRLLAHLCKPTTFSNTPICACGLFMHLHKWLGCAFAHTDHLVVSSCAFANAHQLLNPHILTFPNRSFNTSPYSGDSQWKVPKHTYGNRVPHMLWLHLLLDTLTVKVPVSISASWSTTSHPDFIIWSFRSQALWLSEKK